MDAGKTILVVEDDFDVRESITDALEDEGYLVAAASDGFEALAWLRSHAAPSLILLDWMMPHCDGAHFLELQHADQTISAIPVILLTADVQKGNKTAALGDSLFLRKPVTLDDLLSTVQQVLK